MLRFLFIPLVALFSMAFMASNLAYSQEKLVLNFLIWEGYAPEKHIKIFEDMIRKKYKVDFSANVKYVSDPDEFIKSIQDRTADVITPSHNLFKDEKMKLIADGFLIPVDLNNIPNYKEIFTEFQTSDYCVHHQERYCIPFTNGLYALGYNTALLKESPKSWKILLDPQYKGKYSLSSDYYEANIYMAALMAGIPAEDIFSYDKINTPEVKRILGQIVQNAKSFWIGVDKAEDLQGLSLGLAWGFSFNELKKKGEHWKMANPVEGTTAWIDNFALTRNLKEKPLLKKIAEEWLNYALSVDYQVNEVAMTLSSSPVNRLAFQKIKQKGLNNFEIFDPELFKSKHILWRPLTPRDRNGFKLLWQSVYNPEKK